jgi:hypothetical protein
MLIGCGVAAGLLALVTQSVPQTPPQAAKSDTEARLDQAFKQIQSLNTLVTGQASRITNLERSVRALQDQLTTPVGSGWKTAEGWAQVRIGMSRTEVENILGSPRTVNAVIDKQTLTYGTSSGVVGTVTLVDDRVSNLEAAQFKISLPAN